MRLARLVPIVFGVSLAYAVLRYHVFKGVPLDHLPMYVLNKVVSMTALFLIGLSNVSHENDVRRRAGMAGFAAAGLHVLLSQALLSPDNYPKMFAAREGLHGLSLSGEISLLSGSLGIFLLFLLAWPRREESAAWHAVLPRLVRGTLALAAFHCLFYGWPGWWTPASWPGGLPPITLLSFLFAVGALVVGMLRRSAGSGREN